MTPGSEPMAVELVAPTSSDRGADPGIVDSASADAPAPRPRSVYFASVIGPFAPARAAARTASVPLSEAFGVHLVASLLAVVIILILAAVSEVRNELTFDALIHEMIDGVEDFVRDWRKDPLEISAAVLATAVAIECGFCALAVLLSPWGAANERLRDSIRHSLRQMWLHTPHAVMAVLLVGIVVTVLDRAQRNYLAQAGVPPHPKVPFNEPQGSLAWQEYNQAAVHWQAAWRRIWNTRPFLVRFTPPIIAQGVILAGGWLIWAGLRRLAAPRAVSSCPYPPRCDRCGYDLTATALDSRCPECGDPVAWSLGPDARPGPVWCQRRVIGRPAAWSRTARQAVADPARFARQLRILSPTADHRVFLALHLPIIFVIGALGMFTCYLIAEGIRRAFDNPDDLPTLLAVAPLMGSLSVLAAVGLPILVAAVIGFYESVKHKRNVLPGAFQVACYMTGFVAAWVVFAWANAAACIALNDWSRTVAPTVNLAPDMVQAYFWLIPNLAVFVAYLALVAKGTAAVRYANR